MDVVDVMEQARDVIARTFGLAAADVPDSVSMATFPRWDSLHHLTLVLSLEDQFGLAYGSDEMPRMTSLEDITRITARHLHLETSDIAE